MAHSTPHIQIDTLRFQQDGLEHAQKKGERKLSCKEILRIAEHIQTEGKG
jgi:hypothetical protein